MEKDLNNDKFKGALFQNFENEAIKAPEIAWNNIEKELFKNSPKNFLRLNSLMNKNFYKDCNMFADTLHLSKLGVSIVDKILFQDKKKIH
jgi:hypothetical protein